jgi:AraC family transcriptional regulator
MEGIDIGALIGQHLGSIMARVQQSGAQPGGAPFVRYHAWGGEQADLEIGVPVTSAPTGLPALSAVRSGEVGASELPGGPAALTVHRGPYDQLGATYGALHDWIHAQGRDDGPGPWESYVDDPGSVADPADLRTEVYWPLG